MYAAFLQLRGAPPDPAWLALESHKCRVRPGPESGQWMTDAPAMPVVTVTLAGALAYCEWLSARTGVTHRLPSEAEWEKAARGPRSLTYAYGNVYRRRGANQESGHLREVASFPANDFGLFDMTGNAFEWTADSYDAEEYRHHQLRPPRPASRESDLQVLRGGSYVLDGMYLRNSFRMRQSPALMTDDFGFRVVREAPPAPAMARERR